MFVLARESFFMFTYLLLKSSSLQGQVHSLAFLCFLGDILRKTQGKKDKKIQNIKMTQELIDELYRQELEAIEIEKLAFNNEEDGILEFAVVLPYLNIIRHGKNITNFDNYMTSKAGFREFFNLPAPSANLDDTLFSPKGYENDSENFENRSKRDSVLEEQLTPIQKSILSTERHPLNKSNKTFSILTHTG